MKIVFAILLSLPLAGCGIARQVQARDEFHTSLENYKACLNDNPATPQRCDGLKMALQADNANVDMLRPSRTFRVLGQ